MYVLRKINSDSVHYDFTWPTEPGTVVECPDWDPKPECGNGLHGLLEGRGEWWLLKGHDWAVIEVCSEDIVDLDDKCKFRRGTLLYRGDPEGLREYLPGLPGITDKNAYWWALDIGDRDIMIDKMMKQVWVYMWGLNFGDCDVMRNRITESEWAYKWAMDIGDCDVMRDHITDSCWAYYWAVDIGDYDVMRNRITESEWAYKWAMDIGDHDLMRDRVTSSEHAYYWARDIGDPDIMIDHVTESEWAYRWARKIGDCDVMIDRVTDPKWAYYWNGEADEFNQWSELSTDERIDVIRGIDELDDVSDDFLADCRFTTTRFYVS